jgi:hypothetical protein
LQKVEKYIVEGLDYGLEYSLGQLEGDREAWGGGSIRFLSGVLMPGEAQMKGRGERCGGEQRRDGIKTINMEAVLAQTMHVLMAGLDFFATLTTTFTCQRVMASIGPGYSVNIFKDSTSITE